MPAKVILRSDFDALQLRQFAKRSSDTRQTCRSRPKAQAPPVGLGGGWICSG